MTISRKAVFSLLISIILFAAFTVFSYTGLFNLVEVRFYRPAVMRSLSREIKLDTEITGGFLEDLRRQFSAALEDGAVKRSFLPVPEDEDIFERSRIFGLLTQNTGGLQWVRFVDPGGSRLHYSTAAQDVLSRDGFFLTYRSYHEAPGAIAYDLAEVPDGGEARLIMDETENRIIFAFPFYDSFAVYRGTALFSLSGRAVANRLFAGGRIKPGEDITLVSDPPGILSAMPNMGRQALTSRVSSVWRNGGLGFSVLDAASSAGTALALVSSKTAQGIYMGRVMEETLFLFPRPLEIILLVSFFLTVYLSVFLFFNLRQDSLTVIQNRLKRLQISLIEECYDRKTDMDWGRWSRELEQRREEIHAEVKRGLNLKAGRPVTEKADLLIDNSWDALTAFFSGRRGAAAPELDRGKLQTLNSGMIARAGTAGEPADNPPDPPAPPGGTASALPGFPEAGETEEEPETLEELDPEDENEGEAGEEELEILPAADDEEDGPAGTPEPETPSPAGREEDPASRIEFSPSPEPDGAAELLPLGGDFKIVSPFSSILSKLAGGGRVEEAGGWTEQGEPPPVNAGPREGGLLQRTEKIHRQNPAGEDENTVIELRDGVPRIKKDLFGDTEGRDAEFMKLVDSVMKNPPEDHA